ncbi:ground-like domain protein [Onchocerca flexuosa]|uniref:Ground-like domain protein n=1 Tax=Onchocerca flexuosa TaxID=387005 RepID=A0A238C3P9_9BILA|nr:ground-like domain protein [Onchocerca flexuosa]
MEYINQIVFIICSIYFTNYINQAVTTSNEGSQQNPFVTLSSILSQQSLPTSNNNEINDSDSSSSANKDVIQEKTKGESMIHLSEPTKSRPHLSRSDTKCNNAAMRKVISQNIHSNPATAKRLTQLAVRDKFSGFIDAICSNQPFSYVINSDLYCEVQKFNVTCLVFRQAVQ